MAVLGRPEGVFELDNSDVAVGSFMRRQDIAKILGVSDVDLAGLPFGTVDGQQVVDERILQRSWYEGLIPNAPSHRSGNSKKSMDEMVLAAIIKRELPNAQVEQQVPWGRKKLDLVVTHGDTKLIIEFHGPGHFAAGQYGPPEEAPAVRKEMAEDAFGYEYVIWPYWIQRCARNVRALFDPHVEGLGVLWSTEVHFGDFVFPDSDQIIDSITRRFNAVDKTGYGYFYEAGSKGRTNPVHPIVNKIISGKANVDRLIPSGAKDRGYWLPSTLQNN